MSKPNTITAAHIQQMLARSIITDQKMGEKTTVVCCKLPNGFEIIESSGCVDPTNYDHAMGVKLCMERITNRLWQLEGYWLQAYIHGTKLLTEQLRKAADRATFTETGGMNEEIARVAHEVNRAYCAAIGDHSQLPWAEAPEWQRQSAIKGVAFHRANPDASASASHDNWLKEKLDAGWKYGPVKNADTKEHPCMVEFTDLPQAQQVKDHLFRAVVHAIAG